MTPTGFDDPHAFLEIDGASLTTVYRGSRIPLRAATQDETCTYLAAIAALDQAGSPNATAATQCRAPATGATNGTPRNDPETCTRAEFSIISEKVVDVPLRFAALGFGQPGFTSGNKRIRCRKR